MINIDKIKNEHLKTFILLIAMYLVGVLGDAFGYLNWVVNCIGIIVEIAAVIFILADYVILFDSGILPSRKAVIINLVAILISLIAITVSWYFKMVAFIVVMCLFVFANFVFLVVALYRMSVIYVETVKHEVKEKNINKPRAKISDITDYL